MPSIDLGLFSSLDVLDSCEPDSLDPKDSAAAFSSGLKAAPSSRQE